MKRILIILCIFANIGSLCAQELTPSQTKLRNEIKTFLQKEGFVPSIDSDGDIAFKSEGSSFWVTVSPDDDVPMFTSLNIGFSKPEDYSLYSMRLAAAELNYYKGVKVLCFEDSFTISAELFVMEAEQFNYSFYTMLAQIRNVAGAFVEAYEKYKGQSSSRSNSQSSRSQSSYTSSSSSSNLRTVTTKDVSLRVSEQVQLSVPGKKVTEWESDNEQIARVSNSGVVTGLANGSTSIWAHYGSELKLFRITVGNSTSTSSSSSSSSSLSSSSSGASRTIYSKEATIKVGERVSAQLSEGKVERWEIDSNSMQYLSATSNGTITAMKAGKVSIWGYIGDNPKLFRLEIVGTGTHVPQDRAPYVVTSKEFSMYVGDLITARLSDGTITRWELESFNRDYFSVDGNILKARRAGKASIWGYIGDSPKRFIITIKSR